MSIILLSVLFFQLMNNLNSLINKSIFTLERIKFNDLRLVSSIISHIIRNKPIYQCINTTQWRLNVETI
jgi:hypothetical protein